MLRTLLLALAGLPLAAQTQIDLHTQAKNIDFTAANSTKPIKIGTVLPATCAPGDMFFKTNAQAGENLYGCPAANTWSAQGGIPSGDCQYEATSQILTCMDSNGNVYATVETAASGTPDQWIDYITPAGIPHTSRPTAAAVGAVADPGSNGIPYRNGSGTSAPAGADQMSGPFFCQDVGAGGGYACNLNPPISNYTAGTSYWFKAGAANTGAATINFNALGPKTIVKQYNQALAANDIRAGQWVIVTYDGTNMQMQSQTANAPQGLVASVFGRTGAVVSQSGDYNTSQVAESGNLYFTNARTWAALSASSPITFNGSTGAVGCATCLTTGTTADTDLSGTFPHLSVAKVNGASVPANNAADQVLGTTASATGSWMSIPNCPSGALQYSTSTHAFACGAGGATLRTYPYFWQGATQAGVSGFAVNLPAAASAPTPATWGGVMPVAVLEWPTAQSTYYAWWTWIMPAGYVSNAAISYSLESRCNPGACDSTNNNIVTLGLGCSGGAALDAPAIVNASPFNVKNGAAAAQTVTAGTITPGSGSLPACAAGNRVWVRMIVDTNTHSLTGPFDLVSALFSVQGGM